MREWSTKITVGAERDTKSVDVPALERAPVVAKPGEPLPEAPPQPRSKALPIGFTVGALALGGTALGFKLWGDSIYDKATMAPTNQERMDGERDANTRLYIAQGVAIASVGCAGVAVWLWLRNRNPEPTTTAHVVVSPTGIAVVGQFW
jgi:hypothetical protein